MSKTKKTRTVKTATVTKMVLKSLPAARPKVERLLIKLQPSELETIERNARRYTGGNVSAWLRYTGQNYTPKGSELRKSA